MLENILITMIADENPEIRLDALKKILNAPSFPFLPIIDIVFW